MEQKQSRILSLPGHFAASLEFPDVAESVVPFLTKVLK